MGSNFALLEKHLESDLRRQQPRYRRAPEGARLSPASRYREHLDLQSDLYPLQSPRAAAHAPPHEAAAMGQDRRGARRQLPPHRNLAHLLRRGPDHGLQGRAVGPARVRRQGRLPQPGAQLQRHAARSLGQHRQGPRLAAAPLHSQFGWPVQGNLRADPREGQMGGGLPAGGGAVSPPSRPRSEISRDRRPVLRHEAERARGRRLSRLLGGARRRGQGAAHAGVDGHRHGA